MYKIINGHTPNYLPDLVQTYAENVHYYNLHQQISNENLRFQGLSLIIIFWTVHKKVCWGLGGAITIRAIN
jgi:hypothetical protein